MPLINCPECSHSVSDKALDCPSCGARLRKPKRGFFGKIFGGVLKSMLTLNEAIIDVKEG